MGRYSTPTSAAKGSTLNTRSRTRKGANRNPGSREADLEAHDDAEGMVAVPGDDDPQTNTETRNYKGLDRLKWNSELHELFVSCVNRLGGPYAAKVSCWYMR